MKVKHCTPFAFTSLSLCLMNLSSTTAPDNTSCFFFFLFFDFFSHPDTFSLLSLHFCLADTVFFHQVRMLPPDLSHCSSPLTLSHPSGPHQDEILNWESSLEAFGSLAVRPPRRPAEIKDKNITPWTPLCTRSSGYLMSTTLKSTGLVLRCKITHLSVLFVQWITAFPSAILKQPGSDTAKTQEAIPEDLL